MQELKLILMLLNGGGLWALGGTVWTGWRRYILPVVLFLLLCWSGITWYFALLAMCVLSGVAHLGYGASIPYWRKFLVGCSYSLPSLCLGYSIWVFIVPAVFIGTFALSNWRPTAGAFPWKVCEFIVGTVSV